MARVGEGIVIFCVFGLADAGIEVVKIPQPVCERLGGEVRAVVGLSWERIRRRAVLGGLISEDERAA